MSFKLFREPIIPASPAGLSSDELRRYLGVGRNNVTPIARRFGIAMLHGIYPESVVWRQMFGLEPSDDAARAALREPLADINWTSQATGVPPSTLRAHLRSGTWKYDGGFQLGDDQTKPAPRLRRWIPAFVRSRALGFPPPAFTSISPLRLTLGGDVTQAIPPLETADVQPSEDVFSALFSASEHAAR